MTSPCKVNILGCGGVDRVIGLCFLFKLLIHFNYLSIAFLVHCEKNVETYGKAQDRISAMGKARVCALYGCTPAKNSDLKYHKFPQNDDLAKVWLHKCRRLDRVNVKIAVICEKLQKMA